MTRWATFVGVASVVLVLVLLLARVSQRAVTDPEATNGRSGTAIDPGSSPDPPGSGPERVEPPLDRPEEVPEYLPSSREGPPDRSPPSLSAPEQSPVDPTGRRRGEFSTGELLANVVVSQGVLAFVLVFGAWYAQIPARALGLASESSTALWAGVGLGVGLYLVNEVGATVADRMGLGHDERLREMLAPDSLAGWLVLLVVVLPVIAGFEELLFRAALVGVVPEAYGVSPWIMVVVSSVAFGVGHGAQGPTGMVVTGALGAVLAAAFVVTGSLIAVVLAHYLVNALEFLVHEALGIDWASTSG